jgi:hypothetical protein
MIMALQGWYVSQVERKDISKFVEDNHYSGSINGCISDYCFALYSPDMVMKGAMFYGRMAMANQYKKFDTDPSNVIELRRLCCVDDTPRNAESFFIGRTIKILKKVWSGKVIVSYADQEYGHAGTIYKASNFTSLGKSKGAKVIVWGEKRYHDKAIRTKYKGNLKPFSIRLIEAIKNGEAVYKETAGKITYVMKIRD